MKILHQIKITLTITIYIYIYMCVCMCVCVCEFVCKLLRRTHRSCTTHAPRRDSMVVTIIHRVQVHLQVYNTHTYIAKSMRGIENCLHMRKSAVRIHGLIAVLPCPSLPCPLLPFPSLPCPSLPCPLLPCPSLPCPSLPCPTLPCPSLPWRYGVVCIVCCLVWVNCMNAHHKFAR